MLQLSPRGVPLACLFAAVASAQDVPMPGPRVESLVRLRFATFDPLVAEPAVPAALATSSAPGLCLVQLHAAPTDADRTRIAAVGGEIVGYLPERCYVVRVADPTAVAELASDSAIRWVGSYHAAYRLEPELHGQLAASEPLRCNVVVADKRRDKPALRAKVEALGGVFVDAHAGSLLVTVDVTGPQLARLAALPEVVWVDRWTPVGIDMDNARIQGGANYLENATGFTGAGVNAHVYEGVEATHPDFTGGAVNVQSSGAAESHGHATAGIVWGNGTSNPAVRGMAPDCGKFYTNYNTVTAGVSRWQVVDELVNLYGVSHTSASWGNTQTTAYTSVSAEADDIVFDHDIAWTQSQSNTGNQNSRPQAWAKNVFSIGAVQHQDDSNPANDSWQAGNASTGPAADGRRKPDLCAYFDAIGTSDRTGAAGYSNGNWYASFNGTSGATPIVAGHDVLAIQVFTSDPQATGFGPFGNPLRVPGGTPHQNRPHFPTLKALQVVSAEQYAFTAASNDNRRNHQGWGFPNLRNLWDRRGATFVVDETSVLTPGAVDVWQVTVPPGEPSLKICLNWSEPAAIPSAAQQLVNDLSLRVTAPDGTEYWGNVGLDDGVWSVAGGSEDTVDSIENVFVPSPLAGVWFVEVMASSIALDNHVETPAVDADYALVIVGGATQAAPPGALATVARVGSGCDGTACRDAIYEFPGFDLANSGFTLDWNGADYTLEPLQGTWIPAAGTNLQLGNNAEVQVNAGFTLPFPGGATGTLRISSNGWVATNTFQGANSTVPSIADFLQNTMWAGLWCDLNPSAGGSVWFDTTSARAVVSWVGVPTFPNQGASSFQIQFWNGGTVHFVYQNVTVFGDVLVGFTDRGPVDPGSLDISASLNAGVGVCTFTPAELTLDASARPVIGSVFDLVTTEVHPATLFAAQILSVTPLQPGIDLSPLGMPGCELYETLDVLVLFAPSGSSGSLPWPIPFDPTLAGVAVYAQTATLTPGINPFGFAISNGLELVVGLN